MTNFASKTYVGNRHQTKNGESVMLILI